MTDEYTTIRAPARDELHVKGSRFIACASPVASKADVDDVLERERRQYHGATHYCFAYRLRGGDEARYFSDGGEPAGSAGKPILAAIDRRRLSQVAVVVTRYFGGIKLGTGGLARAYREVADRALQRAAPVLRFDTEALKADFPHAMVSSVMHVVSHLGAHIADTAYDEEVHLVLEIRASKLQELRELLVDRTRGNIRLRAGSV